MTRLVLISGSVRDGSTNTALLRAALEVLPDGVEAALYDGMTTLPHFNPDDDAEGTVLPEPVVQMRAAIDACDAVLLCTPEYAGALPGAFKNLMEWTVGGAQLYDKPVAWVNVSAGGPTSGQDAHDSLRKVLGYCGAAIAEEACTRIPVTRAAVGEDGAVADAAIRTELAGVLERLVAAVDAVS